MPTAYRRLLLAGSIDGVGDGAFLAAVSLLAVTITRNPQLVSVVAAASTLPWLLVSLPAGVLIDLGDRVSLMWRCQAAQAVIVAIIAVLAAIGRANILDLAVLAFLLGIGEVMFGNAAQSVLPEIVPKELLHKANGRQYAVQMVSSVFIGPHWAACCSGFR